MKLKLSVLLLGLAVGLSATYLLFRPSSESSPSVVPISIGTRPIPTPTPSTGLSRAVGDALQGARGTYGIVVKNLKTGESYYLNSRHVFAAASLYKLWIMAAVEQQIQTGAVSEDEMLIGDVDELNSDFNIVPQDAQLTAGSINLSVHDALNQMTTISHNYSALMLTRRIGKQALVGFLQTTGLSQSHLGNSGDPTTSAADIADLLEMLYRSRLTNQSRTLEMLGFLKSQQLNSKFPKYLPKNITVAHKTGEIDSDSHDAGIMYTPAGDILIVVMTETDDPPTADEHISDISAAVYKYFNP